MARIKGWKKIVFSNNRMTYRNDKEDVNVYITSEDIKGYPINGYSVDVDVKNKEFFNLGIFKSFEKAKKRALKYIRNFR